MLMGEMSNNWDGHLQQWKQARCLKKKKNKNPNLGTRILAHTNWK